MPSEPVWLSPQWGADVRVRSLMSTRRGGHGCAPFDSFNLALHPGDAAAPDHRRRFALELGAEPVWLHQVHGAEVVVLDGRRPAAPPKADASITCTPGVGCAVMVADCLPVLLCAADGAAVGAVHAGWRGLAAGVLEHSVAALCTLAGCRADQVRAWLGPCIGPARFEVGPDVLAALHRPADDPGERFRRADRGDGTVRWLADLAGLARDRLHALGVTRTSGGSWCTVDDASAFFSFRRDGRHGPTGRMAAAIAIG